MQEMDRRIASLKLRLAEIASREQALRDLRRQYRQQIDRSIEYAIWAESHLDTALGIASDVEVKLRDVEAGVQHLEAIKARAQEELHTLLLTRSVEDARTQLAQLEERRRALAAEIEQRGEATPPRSDLADESREVSDEIRRLRRMIDDASDEAARHISNRVKRSAD